MNSKTNNEILAQIANVKNEITNSICNDRWFCNGFCLYTNIPANAITDVDATTNIDILITKLGVLYTYIKFVTPDSSLSEILTEDKSLRDICISERVFKKQIANTPFETAAPFFIPITSLNSWSDCLEINAFDDEGEQVRTISLWDLLAGGEHLGRKKPNLDCYHILSSQDVKDNAPAFEPYSAYIDAETLEVTVSGQDYGIIKRYYFDYDAKAFDFDFVLLGTKERFI